ncbi:Uncharacterised protein [Mycobacterium tuberculosis]|nr:Uncharacterised protein [Mycobacterium tuberculosis]
MTPWSIHIAVLHSRAKNSLEWLAKTRIPERSTKFCSRDWAFLRKSASTAPMPSSSNRISGSMLVTTPIARRTRIPVE